MFCRERFDSVLPRNYSKNQKKPYIYIFFTLQNSFHQTEEHAVHLNTTYSLSQTSRKLEPASLPARLLKTPGNADKPGAWRRQRGQHPHVPLPPGRTEEWLRGRPCPLIEKLCRYNTSCSRFSSSSGVGGRPRRDLQKVASGGPGRNAMLPLPLRGSDGKPSGSSVGRGRGQIKSWATTGGERAVLKVLLRKMQILVM